MGNNYYKGAQARLFATFTNIAGQELDPTVVIAEWIDPAGAKTIKTYVTDPEVKRSDTGDYYIDIDLDLEGTYYIRWYSTGTGKAAGESQLAVIETDF